MRPHPKIGTIELRVLDSQTNLKDTLALTALTQCLVAQVLEEVGPHEPYNMHLAVENKFRAARYGMDAAFYDDHDKITIPARDLARNLVERLKPHAQDLGCESELEGVLEIVEGGTGSRRQLALAFPCFSKRDESPSFNSYHVRCSRLRRTQQRQLP